MDFYRRINSFGYITKIIKTCFYSSYIGLIIYENGICSYNLLSETQSNKFRIYSGDLNIVTNKNKIMSGYSVLLNYLNLFNVVNNIELLPHSGSTLMRSAGCSGLITSKLGVKTLIKLKSG
jgi:ribosomal protein L2